MKLIAIWYSHEHAADAAALTAQHSVIVLETMAVVRRDSASNLHVTPCRTAIATAAVFGGLIGGVSGLPLSAPLLAAMVGAVASAVAVEKARVVVERQFRDWAGRLVEPAGLLRPSIEITARCPPVTEAAAAGRRHGVVQSLRCTRACLLIS